MGKRNWSRFLCFALGMVFYALALIYCRQAQDGMGLTYLLLNRNVDSASVERIAEQEAEEDAPLRFCFFGEGEKTTVSCALTALSCPVTQTCLAGNPELLGGGILLWQRGCLLDENTAATLFRTRDYGGQLLSCGGEELPVLGIASPSQPTVVRLARPEDGEILSRCVLSLPPGESRIQGERFLLRHGLDGITLDYFPFWALTRNGLLLFPGLLLFRLCGTLRGPRQKFSLSGILHGRQRTAFARMLLSLCLGIAGVWLLGKLTVIPGDMIPSRWSDFSFWDSWWESQKRNCSAILSAAPSDGQLQMTENMIKSMGSALASLILGHLALRRRYHADIAD